MPKHALNKKEKIFNSRRIYSASALMFIAVAVIMFLSSRYMNSCVEREAQAEQNRTELSALGEALADASDYLTDEARKFSVTGNIEHLYNYWFEVNDKKTRDTVIERLSSYEPPENEQKLLSEAKSYSDELIKTETVSMKLMLEAKGITSKELAYDEKLCGYVSAVEECELPDEYEALSPEEKSAKSREILYDSFYSDSKDLIMSPIGDFQKVLAKRLDDEVRQAAKGRSFASYVQLACSAAVLALIAVLLIGLNSLYIKPLNRYSRELSRAEKEKDFSDSDFSQIRVTPEGAYELYRFGEIFNRLSLTLNRELKRRTEAEQAMRTARDEADSANAAKSIFFANMSHELRTPLNAITGYLYLLEKTPLDDKQKKYCRSIEVSSENLLGLINNVLDFSKIESGKMQLECTDFDLTELLGDVCGIMENSASQKGIALIPDLSGDIPLYVKGDPLRLRQVLINLLGNGLKFTSRGSVTLSAEYLGDVDGKALMSFAVTDTGIGIAAEDIPKIFEPFVQTDAGVTRKYGGTGLGLPISQSIVQNASGGKYGIEVTSEEGKGSRFSFKMEFEYGSCSEKNCEAENDVPFDSGVHILLVDDNKVNLDIEQEILRMYGAEVITADCGAEAVKCAQQHTPDLIFLDLHMPDMDGYETARRIRRIKACRLTPIIALTADVVSGVSERVRAAGMNDYISKPFDPKRLRELIEEYLGIAREAPEQLYTGVSSAFDSKRCLEELGGNQNVLIRSVKRFLQNNEHTCEQLRIHIANGNYAVSRRILHDVAGVSGNLRCMPLYEASRTLLDEMHAQKHDSDEEFYHAFEEAAEEMREYLKINDIRENEGDDIPFEDKLKKLLKLCREFDISAAEYFDENRSDFRNGLDREKFHRIEELAGRYDFAGIVILISDQSVDKKSAQKP
ncbi:MAG: response regulator [Oscillospiraceae bacterium]